MPDDELKLPQQSTKRSSKARLAGKQLLSAKSQKSSIKKPIIVKGRSVKKGLSPVKGASIKKIKWDVIDLKPVRLPRTENAVIDEFQNVPGGVPVDNEEIEQRKVLKRSLADIVLAHEQMGVDHKEIEQLKRETRSVLDSIRAALNG